jgi:hypothetical protein
VLILKGFRTYKNRQRIVDIYLSKSIPEDYWKSSPNSTLPVGGGFERPLGCSVREKWPA